ncbi:MAG: hypothetical protein ACRBBK_03490 [Paracoccaceae bacterium]
MDRYFDALRKRAGLLPVLACVLFAHMAMLGPVLAQEPAGAFAYSQARAATPAEAKVRDHAGLFMLDYQDIRLPGNESIDLLGYHILTPVNDWLYLGIGSYAPFLKGEYGGFMAFGVKAHAQRKIAGNLFVNGGLSFGGGGGGKSIAHSVALSGTGGYMQGYFGLGYAFSKFSAGVNISHMTFFNSSINNTQINVFFQRPFSFSSASFGRRGERVTPFAPNSGAQDGGDFGSMITIGLEHYSQINPTGSFKGAIGAADLQYSKFMSKNRYWFYALGVGYKGLPTYNQAIGGLGYRFSISPRINLYGQLGIGSAGYAPALIDTGSGLLLYPKLIAEYKINKGLGLAFSTGYTHAIDGSSRNYTFGLALVSHFRLADAAKAQSGMIAGQFKGFRFGLNHETAFDISYKTLSGAKLNMLVINGQKTLTDHLYLPIRAGISYQSYRGYPGYGEVSAGLGLNSKPIGGARLQLFGEVHLGANVQGPIARAAVGIDYGLKKDWVLRGLAGKTYGKTGFRSTNIAVGLTRRFSVLNY